jgi:hypothetical protein
MPRPLLPLRAYQVLYQADCEAMLFTFAFLRQLNYKEQWLAAALAGEQLMLEHADWT